MGTAASRPVALVTGAARRLGRAIALDLAFHGFDLAVHYHQSRSDAEATVADLRAAGARAEAFAADLADEPACRALVPSVVAAFGRLDVVVNNASLFEYDDVADFGFDALDRHMRANTAPAVLLARALHADVEARGAEGCVVNLLDQKLAHLNPDHFSYTLSKAALQAATVMLAQALAPRVRVAAVSPGITLGSDAMTESQFAQAQRMTPLGRSSTPADIARSVRFIIESPAITGSVLQVDGGQHLLGQPRDVLFLTSNKKG